MRNFFGKSVAVGAIAMLALTACGSGRDEESGGSGTPAKGFAADSLIGVALPAKTSENWVLAGDLFTNGLKEAGFQSDVQYAGASTTVADQQAQITAMTTKGAKVIIIGATDAAQLSTQVAAAHAAGAKVIAYDRLITNTPDLDYYVAFDNFKVGQLQGQALLGCMGDLKGSRHGTSSCSPARPPTPTPRCSSPEPWTCCSPRSTTARSR